MSLLRRGFLLASVAVLFTASQAFAGGGSKRNSTIKVVNATGDTIYVYYDDTNAAITSALALTDNTSLTTAFTAAGGVAVSANGHTSFSVKAGTYTIVAFDSAQIANWFAVPNTTAPPSAIILTLSVTVHQGQTAQVIIGDNPGVTNTSTTAADITVVSTH